jgi:IclR family transcriptional regulator, KDG regulon repressor
MTTDNRTKPELSQTLARGLTLLQTIADGREGVPVRELAAVMQLPRSIVQRLLYTLEAEGFLERHPSQVGYRLAIKMWSLGCAAVRRLDVRDVARPALEQLAAQTCETVKIGVLEGHEIVYLDGVESPQAVRAFIPIGGRAQAHSIATGKAILAFLPHDRLARLLDTMGRQLKNSHLATPAYRAELDQVRKRGFAVNRGEREQEVGAVAAPIFDAQGEVVASIGVILPLNRLTGVKTTQISAWTTAAAATISAKLGHRTGERLKIKRVG